MHDKNLHENVCAIPRRVGYIAHYCPLFKTLRVETVLIGTVHHSLPYMCLQLFLVEYYFVVRYYVVVLMSSLTRFGLGLFISSRVMHLFPMV